MTRFDSATTATSTAAESETDADSMLPQSDYNHAHGRLLPHSSAQHSSALSRAGFYPTGSIPEVRRRLAGDYAEHLDSPSHDGAGQVNPPWAAAEAVAAPSPPDAAARIPSPARKGRVLRSADAESSASFAHSRAHRHQNIDDFNLMRLFPALRSKRADEPLPGVTILTRASPAVRRRGVSSSVSSPRTRTASHESNFLSSTLDSSLDTPVSSHSSRSSRSSHSSHSSRSPPRASTAPLSPRYHPSTHSQSGTRTLIQSYPHSRAWMPPNPSEAREYFSSKLHGPFLNVDETGAPLPWTSPVCLSFRQAEARSPSPPRTERTTATLPSKRAQSAAVGGTSQDGSQSARSNSHHSSSSTAAGASHPRPFCSAGNSRRAAELTRVTYTMNSADGRVLALERSWTNAQSARNRAEFLERLREMQREEREKQRERAIREGGAIFIGSLPPRPLQLDSWQALNRVRYIGK